MGGPPPGRPFAFHDVFPRRRPIRSQAVASNNALRYHPPANRKNLPPTPQLRIVPKSCVSSSATSPRHTNPGDTGNAFCCQCRRQEGLYHPIHLPDDYPTPSFSGIRKTSRKRYVLQDRKSSSAFQTSRLGATQASLVSCGTPKQNPLPGPPVAGWPVECGGFDDWGLADRGGQAGDTMILRSNKRGGPVT